MLPEPHRPVETDFGIDERVNAFLRRFGQAHLDYAAHAAFPLVLTPDLCYQIWATFRVDNYGMAMHVPWIAVADLLLSDLCKESDQEVFEMAAPARAVLISRLRQDQRFGPQRLSALARYLASYAERQLLRQDPDDRRIGQVQRWVALSYVQPNTVARELALALRQAYPGDKPEAVRVASVVSALQEPLVGFEPLLAYSRSIIKLVQGDVQAAKEALSGLTETPQWKVQVIDVQLPLPVEVGERPVSKDTVRQEPARSTSESESKPQEERRPGPFMEPPMRTEEPRIVDYEWTKSPHGILVVGLGGTGVMALEAIKAQLLDGHSNKMPSNIRLLAFDTERYKHGESRERPSREPSRSGRPLDPGEHSWIGGDIYSYSREIREGKYPHIASWFQSEIYLDTLPRAAFILDQGAGQFRQFGRLAVFHDLNKQFASQIRKRIAQTIIELKGASSNLDVFLISSAAGGTGSGMFVDIAHLARLLAEKELNVHKIRLRGFLVLPEAFLFTAPSSQVDVMRHLAYACMREVRRFTSDFPWGTGYPMRYEMSGTRNSLDSSVRSRVFDAVYCVDGQRSVAPLSRVTPELGVTAALADTVIAMLDDVEDKYGQQLSNLTARNRAFTLSDEMAPCSTVGTYTMVFPARQIVEALSYRLLRQVLVTWCAPSVTIEDDHIRVLAPDQNPEIGKGIRGRDAAAHFLQAGEVRAVASGEVIPMPRLLAEISTIAARYEPNSSVLVEELTNRDPRYWEELLDTLGQTADMAQESEQARKWLERSLISEVPPRTQGEPPKNAGIRISRQVEDFKASHLGRLTPDGGQRLDGSYRGALDVYARHQVRCFREALRVEAISILNGSEKSNRLDAKSGKLGYFRDMVDGLDLLLGRFILAIADTHRRREELGTRSRLMQRAAVARQQMERNPGGFILQPGRPHRAYLEAENEVIASIESDIIESTVRSIAEQMQAYLRSMKSSADSWSATLAIDSGSIHGLVLQGSLGLESELKTLKMDQVRHVLPEPVDYDKLYHRYAEESRDGVAEVLNEVKWGCEQLSIRGNDFPALTLSFAGEKVRLLELNEPTVQPQVQKHNLELLLHRCRSVFEAITEQESILRYLMQYYPHPEALARELMHNSGPLLSFSSKRPIRATFFHISQGSNPMEEIYLTNLVTVLGGMSEPSSTLTAIVQSSDRFSCRIVNTVDLLEPENITSYASARQLYLSTGVRSGLGRETLHIFPAEVNAARFEERIRTELGLSSLELHDKVVLQLENIDRFRLFVRAWVYGVVDRHRTPDGRYCYVLRLADENRDPQLNAESKSPLYLSEPRQQEPDLLEALGTFQYAGKGVRPGVEEPIPYARIEQAIAGARSEAIDRGGLGNPEAELTILRERQALMKQALSNAATPQIRRDLATIFWLALEDDIRAVGRSIDHS